MTGQESTTSIHAWIDSETRHVDLVASWENLCDTYDALRFTDQLSDDERLEEYKWIVQQMNAFLTKVRAKLLSCKDEDAMMDALASIQPPTSLSSRKALVYQKLRQQWVRTTVSRLQMMMPTEDMEEEQDG